MYKIRLEFVRTYIGIAAADSSRPYVSKFPDSFNPHFSGGLYE